MLPEPERNGKNNVRTWRPAPLGAGAPRRLRPSLNLPIKSELTVHTEAGKKKTNLAHATMRTCAENVKERIGSGAAPRSSLPRLHRGQEQVTVDHRLLFHHFSGQIYPPLR